MTAIDVLAVTSPHGAVAGATASGGLAGLRPEDVNAACAGLGVGPYAVARWVVCADRAAGMALEVALWQRLRLRASAEGWRSMRGRDLCRLAVLELGLPRLRRRRAGRVAAGADARTRSWRDADRARVLGVDTASWSRLWAGRYASVWALAAAWLDVAVGHVAMRLRG